MVIVIVIVIVSVVAGKGRTRFDDMGAAFSISPFGLYLSRQSTVYPITRICQQKSQAAYWGRAASAA
jgi:hypothetical protein